MKNLKFKSVILITMLSLSVLACSQNAKEIVLWPNGAPQSNGITEPLKIGNNQSRENVSEAKLYIYEAAAENNSKMAVIICPGGGYIREAIAHEGFQFAEWLSKQGITGIVLEYRLPNKHPEVPLADAQQAIRTIRAKAGELNIDANKIGIAGFSAGGHLASTAGTHFDLGDNSALDIIKKQSCRPDFTILFYPVITMDESFTHEGSRINLLGENPSDDLVIYYSNEKQITAQTPPTVLFLSDDDNGVPPRNSTEFYNSLKNNKIPASMYIFPEGGHGWGMRETFAYQKEWRELLIKWLNKINK